MNSKSKTIAFIGVMSALMFVVMFLETYVFGVLIPIAPPCVLSISLAITLSIYDDWKKMFVGGTIMGCCSFILSFIVGLAPFMLPWISILPRILIGIVAYLVSRFFINLTKDCKFKFLKNYLPYGLGAMFGVMTNTILVLGLLYVSRFIGMSEVLGTFTAINFPIELFGSIVLVPVLVNVIKKFVLSK